MIDILDCDCYIVGFSGGKDGLACILYLLESGIPPEKIEVWHHLVDGLESSFWDWPITKGYVQTVCNALGLKLYFSWKDGGLTKEMLREDSPTAKCFYQTPLGLQSSGGTSNSIGTRWRFPQQGSMQTRYCTSYSKIMVGNAAIAHQDRFKGKRTLFITGERWEESKARSEYEEFVPHATSTKSRFVTHWRAVLDWSEVDVWAIMERWRIVPHPAYRLGFGRCSCIICIFASNDQLASVYRIAPQVIEQMAFYEEQFNSYWKEQGLDGYTIHRSRKTVMERVALGTAYPMEIANIRLATSEEYYEDVISLPGEWQLPSGAFSKDKSGPS